MSGQDGKAKQGLTAPKLPIPGGAEGFKLGPGAQGMLRVPAQTPGAPSCQDEGDATFPSPEPEVPKEESQTKSYPRLEWGKRELGILGKVFSWRCLASGHGKSFCKQV